MVSWLEVIIAVFLSVLLDRLRNGPISYTTRLRGSAGVCEWLDWKNNWGWGGVARRIFRQSRVCVVLNMLLEFGYCSWCSICRLKLPNWFNLLCNIGSGRLTSNTCDFCIDFLSAGSSKHIAVVFYSKTNRVQTSSRYGKDESLELLFCAAGGRSCI